MEVGLSRDVADSALLSGWCNDYPLLSILLGIVYVTPGDDEVDARQKRHTSMNRRC